MTTPALSAIITVLSHLSVRSVPFNTPKGGGAPLANQASALGISSTGSTGSLGHPFTDTTRTRQLHESQHKQRE